jgi:hypothetical protein
VIELDVTIDNLVVVNIATFETRVAHIELSELSLQLELFIPLLRVNIMTKKT